MEREVRKLKSALAGSPLSPRGARPGSRARPKTPAAAPADSEAAEIIGRLEQFQGVAKGEINRLDCIVTQFLQALRPAPPQLKPASLNEVVHKTLKLLEPELENRGQTVKCRLARHLPATPIDPNQIQQVLVNLARNAMQAMTRGGTLTLETWEGADEVWLSVADTGGGIPQEQLKRIFEPFYTTKERGSGLGLMIVERIVRAHGGRIDLESQVGRGTTIRIGLPLHERKPRLLNPPAAE